MSKDELLRFSKFSNEGFKSYQLNYAGRSANHAGTLADIFLAP